MSTASTMSQAPKVTLGEIARAGGIATVIATVINAALYLLGSLFTFPEDAITAVGEPLTLGPVVIVSVIGGLFAMGGFTLLTRFLNPTNTRRAVWVITVLVLLAFTPAPFLIENVDVAQIVIMQIMHVVAGLIPVVALLRTLPESA